MGLGEYKVGAGLAVSDMDRAREFYEGKLGLPRFGEFSEVASRLCT
jgi:hypothetical protein